MAPPKFVPKAIREQHGEIVDASFVEVSEAHPETRKDITELRALAQRHLSNPDRVTRPDSPVLDATGHPIGKPHDQFKPDHEDGAGTAQPAMSVAADTPKAKLAIKPGIPGPQVEPPYARRRPSVETARTSSKGGNLNRSTIR
jgi:hypothetical protein